MKTSKALGSLKSIFPPIHQPLPLNKRESQRLLDTIKKSFRAQLDKEFPAGWTSSSLKVASLTAPTITYLPSTTDFDQASPRNVSTVATDRHLHAIVNNPLFNRTTSLPNHSEMSKAMGGPKNPWDAHKITFHKAVARGLMTIARAHGFLILVQSELRDSSTVSLLEGMKETGAGLLVVQWLQSSGLDRDIVSLASTKTKFMSILLRFMAAEQLDDVVWEWVERLMKLEPAAGMLDPITAPSAYVIREFVKAKSDELELDKAYTAILKGEAIVKKNSFLPAKLVPAWRRLAWDSTVNSWKHEKPPVDLFESFVAMGRTLRPPLLDRAHVDLHHPTQPSLDLAMKCLSNDGMWEAAKTKSAALRARCTSLGIDTVQHLMHLDQIQEATRILDLLRTHLGWGDQGLRTCA
ncbi:hypothetical protein VTK56DRAFT_9818 [Thermocarpiscus australiensis]